MNILWHFMRMASGSSPPGRPGFHIRPLKPDKEIPGGGREYWLTRHDSKHHFKHQKFYIRYINKYLSNKYTILLNMCYNEKSFIM